MGNKQGGNQKRTPQASTGSSTVQTIGRLKKSQNTLEQREKHLDRQILQCLKAYVFENSPSRSFECRSEKTSTIDYYRAKEKMKRKDKRGAMFQLKRKKMLEKNLASLQGMRLNIEQQIMTLESAATTSVMVDSLVDARNEMTRINAKVNVDNLEDLRDDLDERTADQEDITNILSEPMGTDIADDDELLDELNDLETDIVGEETKEDQRTVLDLPVAPRDDPLVLPDAPDDVPVIATKADADELAELEALMN